MNDPKNTARLERQHAAEGMGISAAELEDVEKSMRRALAEAEPAVRGWFEGRVEPTPENRADFDAMGEAELARLFEQVVAQRKAGVS